METLDFKTIPWIKNLPQNWEIKPTKYLIHKIKEIIPFYNDERVISLSMTGVHERDLDAGGKMPKSFAGYQKIEPGNLLMCLFDIDVTPRCVGVVHDEGITSPAYSRFEMKNDADVEYYYYFFLILDNSKELVYFSKNLRFSLTEDEIGKIKVIHPPLEEQKKIADFLDDKCAQIDEITKDLEKKINKLAMYKSQVIYESVTKGLNNNVEYVDSGVSWIKAIPQNWTIRRIRSLLECHESGDWGMNEEDGQTKRICIRIADFNYSSMDIDTSNLTIRGYNRINTKKILKEGDILLEKSGGGDKTPVGRNVYIGSSIASMNCIFTNFIELLRPSNDINSKYLSFAMKAIYSSFDMHFFFNQTTGLQNIDLYEYLKTFIPYPPLEEQKKIADFLDDKCAQIDEITKDLEEKINKLEQYKKEIVFEAVTKGLNPQAELKDSGVYWIGNVPSHWKVVKGKYCFDNDKEIVGARVDQYERLALTLNGVIKRSKDDNEGLQPKDFATYQILRKDELVFKLIDLQNISTSRVGLSPYVGLVSPAYIILKSRRNSYPSYAERFYLMMWYNQIFNHLGDDGVRSSLNASELLNLPFVLPPLEEQKKIADFLDDKCAQIDEITKATREEIETLKQYKQSLIYEYVTGKKEVPNE